MGRNSKPRPDLPPILLSEMREIGLDLQFSCIKCPRNVDAPLSQFDHLPGETTLHDMSLAAFCTHGKHKGGVGVYPVCYRPWVAHLRRTGQDHRIPYFARTWADE